MPMQPKSLRTQSKRAHAQKTKGKNHQTFPVRCQLDLHQHVPPKQTKPTSQRVLCFCTSSCKNFDHLTPTRDKINKLQNPIFEEKEGETPGMTTANDATVKYQKKRLFCRKKRYLQCLRMVGISKNNDKNGFTSNAGHKFNVEFPEFSPLNPISVTQDRPHEFSDKLQGSKMLKSTSKAALSPNHVLVFFTFENLAAFNS